MLNMVGATTAAKLIGLLKTLKHSIASVVGIR
jgi:hypothetical protein